MSNLFDSFGERPVIDSKSIAGERPAWHKDAACRGMGPELFFPERGHSTEEAKKICATCPVVDECWEYASENRERFGIWGGSADRSRRRKGTRVWYKPRKCVVCGVVFEPHARNAVTCGAGVCQETRRRQKSRESTRRSRAAAREASPDVLGVNRWSA